MGLIPLIIVIMLLFDDVQRASLRMANNPSR
jgi:hypothetical protein